MTAKQVDLTKNFFALGLMFWLYERRMDPTLELDRRQVRQAGRSSPRPTRARSRPATPSARRPRCSTRTTASRRPASPPGTYRNITGNEATALGFVAAARAGPADAVLRQLPDHAGQRHPARAVGATRTSASRRSRRRTRSPRSARPSAPAFGGALGLTGTSGPGIALKSEAIGLAVMVELPLVIVDVQRAGPSTGMPTKTEQADLLQVDVRAQRRIAGPHRRAGHAGRVLRHGHRGVAHRPQVT